MKQALFRALDFRDTDTVYDFVEVVNIYHKFFIFESMRKHNSITGVLTQSALSIYLI